MDVTNPQSDNPNLGATIRVETSQTKATSGEKTFRPDNPSRVGRESDIADFVLKGRVYQGIKCLSDNSGEAQVFLVDKDGKDYVLKVYYPNFDVNKKLLQTIESVLSKLHHQEDLDAHHPEFQH